MGKDKKTQEAPEIKTKTKYDLKMERRKVQEEKDRKQEKWMRIAGILLAVVFVCAITASIAMPLYRKYEAVNGTCIQLGSHSVSQQEYDYYYYDLVNSYKAMLASFGGGGVDFDGDLSRQQYSATQTWKEFFDELTVEQLKRNKALNDKADAEGFVYDDTEDYESFMSGVSTSAENAGLSLADYYKQEYGAYITADAAEKYAKESLRANAYYEELAAQNTPSEEEIQAVYEADKAAYDLVDYHSFAFTADVEENMSADAMEAAMKELQEKAEAMENRLRSGEEFYALCAEYAPKEQKENYKDAENDRSLHRDTANSGVPSVLKDWMYDESRKEGDLTVMTDETNHYVYVAEFIGRKYDETAKDTISSNLSRERAEEIVSGFVEAY
ncbi:MAG: hypothetical protein GX234_02515 [Clostridiales bacterium]|nr:hypothetical protein [Clostridiales bacterium]